MIVMPLLGMGGSEYDTLVNDLGMDTAYSSTQASALAELTLTIATNGTWSYSVGAGDTLGGTPTSGTWLAGGNAADYEVQFTPSNQVNSPTITNGASSFSALSAPRTFKVEKNSADASANCLVEIRRIVNPPRTLSESITMQANGA